MKAIFVFSTRTSISLVVFLKPVKEQTIVTLELQLMLLFEQLDPSFLSILNIKCSVFLWNLNCNSKKKQKHNTFFYPKLEVWYNK